MTEPGKKEIDLVGLDGTLGKLPFCSRGREGGNFRYRVKVPLLLLLRRYCFHESILEPWEGEGRGGGEKYCKAIGLVLFCLSGER